MLNYRKGVDFVENLSLYEVNLPKYLQKDLENYKKKNGPEDCLWCELYGSVNSAEQDGEISTEQAWYLREKYLNMERVG